MSCDSGGDNIESETDKQLETDKADKSLEKMDDNEEVEV